ncbi:MAG TPA: insulinase family protein [Terriglobales bacterium]|nr:insulinase family protein [Terriglobales bacterium]
MTTRTRTNHLLSCLLALCALVAIVSIAPVSAPAQTGWQQIPIPPLPAFHPAEPKRIVLPNGMVIFLQEDHELPLIDGSIRIRGGSQLEPSAKLGLVDLYGEVWRTGGTKTQTGDQLDDYLEARAAKVETGGGGDSTSIGWSCLKADYDDVFKIVLDLLHNPDFRADKLELAQSQFEESIARRNDNPSSIAARESIKLAYGSDSPYARQPEYATILAVKRDDLLSWHKQYVQPNNMIVGISGDFDSAAMEAKLKAAFASWPKGPAAPKTKIEIHPAKPGYYLVSKDDVNQSNVRMVASGTDRRNPDYFAIEVFNEVMGGGFSSRLVQDIRTRLGLAYSVGGGIGTSFDHPGVTRFVLGTKSESTVQAVQAVFTDVDDLQKKPITDDEIKRAKDSILNSFIFNFDTPDKVLHERMAYEFYGYPLNFLEQYHAGIEKATATEVNRVALKYLHKDQLAVLVVGNPKDFDKQLSELGPVTNIDITIPPPPGEQPAASGGAAGDAKPEAAAPSSPAASNPEGKTLAAKVAEKMGGSEKLKSVHSMQAKLAQQSKDEPASEMQLTVLYPDHMHLAMESPMGPMTVVFSPTGAFMSAQGQVRPIPPSAAKESLDQIKRDPTFIAAHADDPKFTFTANGSEKISNIDAKIIDINADGTAVRWYVDPASGILLRESYTATGQAGPFRGETDLSDWKVFDGINIPTKHTNRQDNKDSSVVTFTEVHINPEVDPKLFDKPAAGETAK